MLSASNIISFVNVTDFERARRFYGSVLGLELRDEHPFALVAEKDGRMLRITRVDKAARLPYTVLGWTVPDIAAEVDALAARGVEFKRYEGLRQDARGIWTAPSGAKIAWFSDPDENTLSLTEFSPGPATP